MSCRCPRGRWHLRRHSDGLRQAEGRCDGSYGGWNHSWALKEKSLWRREEGGGEGSGLSLQPFTLRRTALIPPKVRVLVIQSLGLHRPHPLKAPLSPNIPALGVQACKTQKFAGQTQTPPKAKPQQRALSLKAQCKAVRTLLRPQWFLLWTHSKDTHLMPTRSWTLLTRSL